MGKKKKRVYAHYGASRFEPSKFCPVKNLAIPWVKPYRTSGLWASPMDSKYGWKQWCTQENFQTERLNSSFRFILKDNAKVAHVRNLTDLHRLPEREDAANMCYNIDFEALAKEYDAIEVHLTEDVSGELYYYLYGWDCDSILILNPDVVEEIEYEAGKNC